MSTATATSPVSSGAEPSAIAAIPSPHTIYNRYAVTPLDSGYYQSCIFWIRVAEITALSALVIIGTIGSVFLYMQGWEISAVLCQLVIMKIGYECHNWCTNTLINQKFARWAAVSRIFEEELRLLDEPIEIRQLLAHYRWYERNATSQMQDRAALLEEINQPQQQPPNAVVEQIERLIQLQQNLAISKIYAAYYHLLIKDHRQKIHFPSPDPAQQPDRRELIDICRINPLGQLYEYAQATYVRLFNPQYNPFFQIGNIYLSADEIAPQEIEALSYVLQNGALPPAPLLPAANAEE